MVLQSKQRSSRKLPQPSLRAERAAFSRSKWSTATAARSRELSSMKLLASSKTRSRSERATTSRRDRSRWTDTHPTREAISMRSPSRAIPSSTSVRTSAWMWAKWTCWKLQTSSIWAQNRGSIWSRSWRKSRRWSSRSWKTANKRPGGITCSLTAQVSSSSPFGAFTQKTMTTRLDK